MRREKTEIISKILEICKEPASKTRIVYQANLNFNTANLYLRKLQKEGLLIRIDNHFRTLPRGDEAIQSLRQIVDLIGSI